MAGACRASAYDLQRAVGGDGDAGGAVAREVAAIGVEDRGEVAHDDQLIALRSVADAVGRRSRRRMMRSAAEAADG